MKDKGNKILLYFHNGDISHLLLVARLTRSRLDFHCSVSFGCVPCQEEWKEHGLFSWSAATNQTHTMRNSPLATNLYNSGLPAIKSLWWWSWAEEDVFYFVEGNLRRGSFMKEKQAILSKQADIFQPLCHNQLNKICIEIYAGREMTLSHST